ncbi:MAG: FG-GAP repeat domain-containing protein [Ardenticatenaceae bacterium]
MKWIKSTILAACLTLFLSLQASAVAVEPRFLLPTPLALGGSPFDLVSGDFNGDGAADIAAANSNFPTNNVGVLLNDGSGAFGPPVITELADLPLTLARADFNRDGEDDLVVAGLSDMRVVLSNGDGTFTQSALFPDDNAELAAADFNRDGKPDFAAASYVFPNGHVKLYFGQGNGDFLPPVDYTGPWVADDLLAADLESDGDADLLYFDSGSVIVRLNDGSGGFGPEMTSAGIGGADVALADFNRDGALDLTSVDFSGGNILVALGNGNGAFTLLQEYNVIDSQGLSVATADFNGDGAADIVAGDDNDVVVLLRGRGDGSFVLAGRYLSNGYNLLPINANGDTQLELAGSGLLVGPNQGGVSYGFGRLGLALAAPPVSPFADFADILELADANGDGRTDAIGGGYFSSGLNVLLNRGNRGMSQPLVSLTNHRIEAMAFGDLNEDGTLDAVVGSVPVADVPNLEILIGDGAGRFAHLASLNNGSGAALFGEALAVADMDGDGHLDIVSNTFTALSVRPGNGDGTFGSALLSGGGNGSSSVLKVRDFNGDSIADVVTVADSLDANDARSTIYLNLGNGDGTLTFAQSFIIDARVPSGDSADLNGDGLPDLAITGAAGFHTGRGGMFVALNVGGSFGPTTRYDAQTASLALGDLNGDARPEAVLTNASAGGLVEIWTNAGTGAFQPNPQQLPSVDSPYEVEIANFRAFPQPDLAVLGSAIDPSKLVIYPNLTR